MGHSRQKIHFIAQGRRERWEQQDTDAWDLKYESAPPLIEKRVV
jgi:hypothetical protein